MFHLSESPLGNGRQSSNGERAGGIAQPSLRSVPGAVIVIPVISPLQ